MIFSMDSTIGASQDFQLYLDEVWEITLEELIGGTAEMVPMIIKDYLLDLTKEEEGSRRRLSSGDVKWEIGTWHFETINQVVAKLKESFFRVNMIEGRKIKIS